MSSTVKTNRNTKSMGPTLTMADENTSNKNNNQPNISMLDNKIGSNKRNEFKSITRTKRRK